MVEVVVAVEVTVSVSELLIAAGAAAGAAWVAQISRENFTSQRFRDGSRFVSKIADGKVCSMFFHPTKWHSATAQGGMFGGNAKSKAPPGEWAVAICNVGIMGAKTFYNDEG